MESFNKYINRSMNAYDMMGYDDMRDKVLGKKFLESCKNYPNVSFSKEEDFRVDLYNNHLKIGCDVEFVTVWNKYKKNRYSNIPARKSKYWNGLAEWMYFDYERNPDTGKTISNQKTYIRTTNGSQGNINEFQDWDISYIQFLKGTNDLLYYPSQYMKKNVNNTTYEHHLKKWNFNTILLRTFISPRIFDTNEVERWRRTSENEWIQVNLDQ